MSLLLNADVLARLKPFGILFERSLSDLIKGIRACKQNPESLTTFFDSALSECRQELKSTDFETKAIAILKLAYLEMYNYDMSWSNFQILEVMSSSKFQQKRIGYLAAMQLFKNEQDLLILATNQFKKDLNSHNHIEIGLALLGIATIVTPNLSKDINDDVLMKLLHSKPYIRKKAILAMYKIFIQYPDSLRLNFLKIIEKLDDEDISVVSATVSVICEISKKNPHIFISYLPKFFTILEGTKNNWLVIRILKLFQSLSKVEPRMKKKIMPTIIDLMLNTQASSLIYECVNCIVNGNMLTTEKDKDTAKLCIKELMEFFKTKDSNLKFVGLLALINILKIYPELIRKVDGVSNVIMECITDNDLIIQRKALEIIQYLVNDDNITEIVKVLLLQLIPNENVVPESLKLDVALKIIAIASQNNYEYIPNFKWYIAVLKDIINLTLFPLSSSANVTAISHNTANIIAREIGKEFKNLTIKVPSIRSTVLTKVISISVNDPAIIENCPVLLKDFYWIMGEYVDEIKSIDLDDSDSEDEDDEIGLSDDLVVGLSTKIQILNNLVNCKIDNALGIFENRQFPISHLLVNLPNYEVIEILIPSLVKVYSGIVSDYLKIYAIDGKFDNEKFNQLSYYLYKLINFFTSWENHASYEVQERALSWLEFLKLSLEASKVEESILINFEKEELAYCDNKRKTVSPNLSDDEDNSDSSEEDSSEEEEAEADYENIESDNEIPEQPVHAADTTNPFAEEQLSSPEVEMVSTEDRELPYLIANVLPSFFKAYELNPIAQNAQKNIHIPIDLNLDEPINPTPQLLSEDDEFDNEYHLYLSDNQEGGDDTSLLDLSDDETKIKKKNDRLERLKDDPYYIASSAKKSKAKTKKTGHLSPQQSEQASVVSGAEEKQKKVKSKKLKKEKVVILSEETIGDNIESVEPVKTPTVEPKKKSKLKIDSSNLDNFDLSNTVSDTPNSDHKEYNIDLEALRKKLSEEAVKTKKKKKLKTKVKTEKVEGTSSLEKLESNTPKVAGNESNTKDGSAEGESSLDKDITSDITDKIIPIKVKKTKKKKAAIIE